MSQTMTIEYPERLPDELNLSRQQFESEARLALAAKWYEMGRMSSAQAAQMAGMDRVRFLFALERLGVSFINVDEDELNQEFAHAREAFASHQ
jgi:predicted HTH domain antitoxin